MDLATFVSWYQSTIGEVSDAMYDEWQERLGALTAPSEPTAVGELTPLSGPVKWLVVHHSETTTGNVELYRWLHRVANGWEDVGYHFIIGNGADGLSTDGAVELGRSASAQGAHVRGHNGASLGICLTGNMDRTPPTAAQLATLRELLERLMDEHGLGVEAICGHRDFPDVTKTCPGALVDLEVIRRWFGGDGARNSPDKETVDQAWYWFQRGQGLAQGGRSAELPEDGAHQLVNGIGLTLKALLVLLAADDDNGFDADELYPKAVAREPDLLTIDGLAQACGFMSGPGDSATAPQPDLFRNEDVELLGEIHEALEIAVGRKLQAADRDLSNGTGGASSG